MRFTSITNSTCCVAISETGAFIDNIADVRDYIMKRVRLIILVKIWGVGGDGV